MGEQRSIAPKAVATVVVAALLAVLASCGVYQAAQASPNENKQAGFSYGDKR